MLHLAPHEVPLNHTPNWDGEPLPFRAQWFGREREFIGQSVRTLPHFYYLFCLRDEPETGCFACAGRRYVLHDHDVKKTPEPFIKSIEKGDWGRIFLLNSQLELSDRLSATWELFLGANGHGGISNSCICDADFIWSSPCARELSLPNRTRFVEPVTQRFREAGDDLRFAYDWANASRFEQLSLVWPLTNGTYEEWEHIVRLHAIATLRWPDDSGWHLYRSVRMTGKGTSAFHSDPRARNSRYQKAVQQASYNRFLAWAHRYFSPVRNDELCARFSCVEFAAKADTSVCEIRATQAPTQHERMEALLQLREWLEGKASPDEIALLLGEE